MQVSNNVDKLANDYSIILLVEYRFFFFETRPK